MVWILIITHIAAFVLGVLVFRNNSNKANSIIDAVKK